MVSDAVTVELNFKLKPDLTLDGLLCKENIHLGNLKVLRNSKELDKTEANKLHKYYDIQTKNGGIVKYHVGNARCFNYGRVSVEHNVGLQYMPRKVRNTLVRNQDNTGFMYIDLDIVNCAPTLLYNFLLLNKDEVFDYLRNQINKIQQEAVYGDISAQLKANRETRDMEKVLNKEFPFLKKYIYTRDAITSEALSYFKTTRDTVKQLFNSMINGGSYYSWIRKNNLVDDAEDSEADSVRMFILGFQKEQAIITDYVENNKDVQNLSGNIKRRVEQR